MKTVEDLGREMKAQHPGLYDDMSDAEVGRRVKAKNPSKYSTYQDIALVKTSSLDLQAPFPDEFSYTQQAIEQIKQHYNPQRGVFTSWVQRMKGEGRNKLLTVLNQEQVQVIQNAAILEQQAMQSRERFAQYQTFLVQNAALIHQLRANEQLINQALSKGRTFETDQQVILEDALAHVRLEEEQARSKIRISEHERLKDIDANAARREATDALDNADRMKLNPYGLIEQLTESLNKMYVNRQNLEQGDDPAKVDKLRRLNKNIRFMERTIDARQNRLLEAEYGDKSRRPKKASTNVGAGYPPGDDDD
jgi:hypothetical protein